MSYPILYLLPYQAVGGDDRTTALATGESEAGEVNRMQRGSARRGRAGWLASLATAAIASAAAMGLMFWARAAFQIRTLPERLMEWVLLFVPLEQFEKGIQQFGPKAKDLALYAGIAVMSLTLLAIGALALRRARTGWSLLLLGGLLWLFAMAGVMPLTGAGFFATGLFQNVALVNASYLGVALAYATVLAGGLVVQSSNKVHGSTVEGSTSDVQRSMGAAQDPPSAIARRPFLAGLGGLAASYLAVAWFARQGVTTTSSLPLAQVKPKEATASPATAAPQPAAASPAPGAPVVGSPVVQAPPAPPASAPAALPVPRPPRALSRDKDGATFFGRKQGELSTLITRNDDFYVVTKNAGGDPSIRPDGWRLIIDGDVASPMQLDYRGLRQLPAVEQTKTLECISNFTDKCELASFGCELISTATWKGVRLKDVLDLAGGMKPSAVSLAVISDDEFSSAIPVEAALDPDTILAYEMNGEVLPYEHGYPARLIVPGRYGMKNAKYVVAIRPMSQQYVDWYGQRNWNKEGIVKTTSRIDLPSTGAELPPGQQRVAGIAYAGSRGVKQVEFSADAGKTWQPAGFLEPQPGKDAWVRWQASFDAPPGASLTLVSRATDGTGEVQTETFSLPQPDGGSGRHSIQVKIRTA